MKVVDVHAHILVPELLSEHGSEPWRPAIHPQPDGGYLVVNNQFKNGPAFKPIVEAEAITENLKAMGVDYAMLSTPPYAFYYDLPPEEGARASAIQNDGLAAVVRRCPDVIGGLGTLPLQDVGLAVAELERVMGELNLSGVEIASNVNGVDLGEDQFRPFWQAVERLGAVVFVHPAYFEQVGSARMDKYYLRNFLGNPMETALFAAHMIFSGMLEDFPNLKVVLAHAGGVIPYLRGRMEHGYFQRKEPRARISRPPSEYLGRLYYDTITHYAPTLQYLVDVVGVEHVLLGSDYPFDMGPERPADIVHQLTRLSQAERELILGGNALRLLQAAPA